MTDVSISSDPVKEALALLDEYLAAFNAQDAERWANTLHFPHVRLAGKTVAVWQDAASYIRSNEISKLATQSGWSHSEWTYRRLVQADADKLHFVVSFTRFAEDGADLGTFDAFYVLTREAGRWGIQARSSYAGVAVPGAAF
jgi:hypothetical protein